MTQPSFVPISEVDQVRPALRLEVSGGWEADRPAELRVPRSTPGRGMGTPGPDQGFALTLARRFSDRLVLVAGEEEGDVRVGAALLASRRAGLFGRAPSVHDLTTALSVFGFLAKAPQDLVAARKELFASVSHDYVLQRALVDSVPEETLRLAPAEIEASVGTGDWRRLLGPPAATAH
jgi:hypothetical protein